MNPLDNYTYNSNFWEINPTLQPMFSKLYKADKTKNKDYSSRIMWGIAFLLERENNKYKNAEYNEKLYLIKEEIIEEDKFNWDEPLIQEMIKKYEDSLIDVLERQVNALEKKMDERTHFMLDTAYDLDNASELDKMFSNTLKLQELLEEAKKRLNASKENTEDGKTKGGRVESLSERGEI